MLGDAVMAALTLASSTLRERGVPLAVMGGVAVSIWKHARATKDVDLLVGIQPNEITGLLKPLVAAGIHPKRLPPVVAINEVHIAQFICQPTEALLDVRVDLLFAESEFQKQALARAVPSELLPPNEQVRVLACEDLVLFKLLAGRMIDRADAAYLLRENRARLDLLHLQHWIGHFGLQAEYDEAWQAAFPGEELPSFE
jgi:hypothetical protein